MLGEALINGLERSSVSAALLGSCVNNRTSVNRRRSMILVFPRSMESQGAPTSPRMRAVLVLSCRAVPWLSLPHELSQRDWSVITDMRENRGKQSLRKTGITRGVTRGSRFFFFTIEHLIVQTRIYPADSLQIQWEFPDYLFSNRQDLTVKNTRLFIRNKK